MKAKEIIREVEIEEARKQELMKQFYPHIYYQEMKGGSKIRNKNDKEKRF